MPSSCDRDSKERDLHEQKFLFLLQEPRVGNSPRLAHLPTQVAPVAGSRHAATVVAISQRKRMAEVSDFVCKGGNTIFRIIYHQPTFSIMVSAREAEKSSCIFS